MTTKYDTIIVGSGIAGATLACDLSKQGQKVLLVEKGGNHRLLGNHPALMRIADRKGFRYTKEHMFIASGITHGGSSVIAAGTAFRPPPNFFKKWDIDLENELNEAEKELGVNILPDELIGKGNIHLLDAGNRVGYEWKKLPKFIDPTKCVPNCSACMLGCKRKAKFTARSLIEEAMSFGLQLQKKNINHVIIEGRKAIGVKPKRGHTLEADRVIVSAGGIHSAILLQKSGIQEAGQSFFMDPLVITYGVASEEEHSNNHSIPMTVGSYKFYFKDGILHSPLVLPWGMFLLILGFQRNPLKVLKFRHYTKLMGIMSKIQDDKNGTIKKGRFSLTVSKLLSEKDNKRIEHGISLARDVLIEAGSKPEQIFSTPIIGAHPGGTNSIGEIVNSDLQTEIPNLFVCDSSILPRSLGTPLILVLTAFARRLSRKIIDGL